MATELQLVPQLVLDGTIMRQDGRNSGVVWMFNREKITNLAVKAGECLSLLGQETGTLVVWQEIHNGFTPNEIYQIHQELEQEIQSLLPEGWEVEAVTPKANKNGGDQSEVSRIVHLISKRYPFGIFAQLTGMGHGRLFDLVFQEGIRLFENRYAAVYFKNGQAFVEQAVIVPQGSDWLSEFQSFILDYDYMAAYELLDELEESAVKLSVSSMLKLMIHRMNFNFEDARLALMDAGPLAGEGEVLIKTKEILGRLLSDDPEERDLERILELYRHLDVYLELDDMVSFLIRFYRAREAILHYLIEYKQKAGFPHKKGAYSSIYQVIEKMEEMYTKREIDSHYGTYFYLKSLNVAKLLQGRNQSFIGHGRSGIDNDVAWQSYFGTSRTTISRAKKRFIIDSSLMLRELGLEMDENIEEINKALLAMSQRLAWKDAVAR
ncbi:hypothetical protein A8F94_21900 [Bacillus sp. FJAT-27225]|uniref:hypothetical protein n=1 Tax=Bacillus sp. FJAT-27225 TaxID=1743144 RepID=UPI00080C2898|nr:hypothetical protein [Bacillus sp. FJAT-27225]OCA81530.1 hypothetical protein A8F94_21900 [Bacillus sp. FJAT-27225]